MAVIAAQSVTLRDGRVVTLRHGVPADAAACLRFVHGVLPESEHFSLSCDEFTFTVEQEADWLRANLENPGSIVIVADLDGEIIGLLDYRPGKFRKCAHQGSFGISLRKAFHNQGVGSAMLRLLIDWARAHPLIEMLSLDVYSTNTRAIALYQRLGFVECGRKPRCHKLGEHRYADDVTMYLPTDGSGPGDE